MLILFAPLITCLILLGIPDCSKAVVDSYSLSEEGAQRSVLPFQGIREFQSQVLEPLPTAEKANVSFLRLGSAVIDDDVPGILEILRSTLPGVKILDLSNTNLSGEELEKSLVGFLELPSLTIVYPSRHFTAENKKNLKTILSRQGKGWFERRQSLGKIKRKLPEDSRYSRGGRDGADSYGRPILLE